MSAEHSPEPHAADGMVIDVLRGTPSEEELAALMAVVSEAYAAEAAGATSDAPTGLSAWGLSQRSLRVPLRRDVGWGRFAG